MNLSEFDTSKSCPIIQNFECVQSDCGFWDVERQMCKEWRGSSARYNELYGSMNGPQTNLQLDLGAYYSDITILVDRECTVKFHDASHAALTFSNLNGRVSVPVQMTGYNVRYILITLTEAVTMNYTIDANG